MRDGVRRALQGKGGRLLVRLLLSSQREIPRLLVPRVLQGLQSGEPEAHRCAELLDLPERLRLAGVLGWGNRQPRRVAAQGHYPRARPRRGIALPVPAYHGALLGAAEG